MTIGFSLFKALRRGERSQIPLSLSPLTISLPLLPPLREPEEAPLPTLPHDQIHFRYSSLKISYLRSHQNIPPAPYFSLPLPLRAGFSPEEPGKPVVSDNQNISRHTHLSGHPEVPKTILNPVFYRVNRTSSVQLPPPPLFLFSINM